MRSIFGPGHAGVGIVARIGRAGLADDYRNVVLQKCNGNIAEHRINRPGIKAFDKCVPVVRQAELVRGVAVDGNDQIFHGLAVIGRNRNRAHDIGRGRSGIPGNHQTALVVVPKAGAADCVDENLIQIIDSIVTVGRAVPFAWRSGHSGLVHALENQVLVIVCKIRRHLRPNGVQFCADILVIRVEILIVDPRLMVRVNDDEKAVVVAIIDDFLNAGEVLGVDCVLPVIRDKSEPGDRNADGVEACVVNRVDERLRHGDVAPLGFARLHVAAARVKGVSDVEAELHHPDDFLCRLAGQFVPARRGAEKRCFRRSAPEKPREQDEREKQRFDWIGDFFHKQSLSGKCHKTWHLP